MSKKAQRVVTFHDGTATVYDKAQDAAQHYNVPAEYIYNAIRLGSPIATVKDEVSVDYLAE
jgi:phage baseplate assembly protein gpV